jgi:general secretion pathway protein J
MRLQERSSASQGFTLVELLVALTLMALLSLVLFGGLRFGVRVWETGGETVSQASRIEAVQNLLRSQVSQAHLPQQRAAPPLPIAFVGRPEYVTFVAPLPVQRGIGGFYQFQLARRDRDGRTDLALAWRRYRAAEDLGPFEEETTLIENVSDVELSYFGAADEAQPAQWWNSWEGAESRPRLIRLRLEFPPGDTRRWPDLIIRVIGSSG